MLNEYCLDNVVVSNRATGGRSTKSFLAEKRWEPIMENMKKGDYVMIQFGHNDQKADQPKRYAPHNTLYKELLTKYIEDTKSKDAYPILVTSVQRRTFKDGVIKNTLGKYPESMREVAIITQTPLIDLNVISSNKFSIAGPKGTKEIFLHLEPGQYENYPNGKADNSHFQEKGAKQIAGWIVEDAKKQKLEISKLFK
jgi:lysophospholipase L1-like esterase